MLIVLSLTGAGAAVAADPEDEAALPDPLELGITAYQRGDFAAALRHFQPLAAQGNAPAQSNLGLMYEEGRGVAQNYREAVMLFRLAAIQGDPSAQSNLGVMYERGQGIARDYGEAIKWYRLAAERRNPEALFNLGVAYKEGRGLPQDRVQAHMWFNLAASLASGDVATLAVRNRDLLIKVLTREQLFLAQDMARRCEANGFKGCE
jgi:TPR repeat protein